MPTYAIPKTGGMQEMAVRVLAPAQGLASAQGLAVAQLHWTPPRQQHRLACEVRDALACFLATS